MAGKLFIFIMVFASLTLANHAYEINRAYRKNSSSPKHKPPSPPPTPPSPTPPSPTNSLAVDFMAAQNNARASVGVNPLVWDSTVQAYAQSWANQRAATGNCQLQHSNGPYGENIFWGSGKSWSPNDASVVWADEKKWYDYNSNSCASGQQCGHYTQIVWRDSQRIGCARVECSSGDVFMTCNYDPPGNYFGEKPY